MFWSRSGARSWLRSPNEEDPDHVRGSWKNKSNWHPKIRWSPEPGPKWNAEFCSWAPDASFLPQGYARGPWSAAEWENASLNVDAMRSLWSLGAMAHSARAAQPKARWSYLQIRLGKKLGVHTNGVDIRSSNYNLLSRIILELNPARTVVLVLTHHQLSWQTHGRASITF